MGPLIYFSRDVVESLCKVAIYFAFEREGSVPRISFDTYCNIQVSWVVCPCKRDVTVLKSKAGIRPRGGVVFLPDRVVVRSSSRQNSVAEDALAVPPCKHHRTTDHPLFRFGVRHWGEVPREEALGSCGNTATFRWRL